MSYIKLEGFSGLSPRTGPTELAPNQAQTARNVKLQSGEIRPWRRPSLSYTPGLGAPNSIYLLRNTVTTDTAWLEWSTEVNVVQGPIADVSDFRVYYTGDGAPKKTNWALATTSGTGAKPFPNAYLQMGVPAPTGAPTLSPSGTTAPVETRAYVYTYISTFGSVLEESAPSPATTVTVETTGTVTVGGFSNAPAASGGYNITALRIYRSVTGSSSVNYQYVGQITVTPSTGVPTASTFVDNVTAANLGVTLTSLYYTPPPAALKGIVALPNGILAGFTGNQIWFSEPYLPHAWPSSYMMTVGAPIVGLGVFGQTLVVCTTTYPYLITGTSPGAMSQEKLPLMEPCVSKKSIVGDQFGVLYASPNGVVSIAPGSMDVITRPLMTRDEWETYSPASMMGAIYQNMYLVFYPGSTLQGCLVFIRGDSPPMITLEVSASAVFVDSATADVFFISALDNLLYELDADQVNNLTFEWKSKAFILPEPTNFAALKIQANWAYFTDSDAYNQLVQEITAYNQAVWASGVPLQSTVDGFTLNTSLVDGSVLKPIPTLAETRSIQVIVAGDGTTVIQKGITSQEPVRMPARQRYYVYEITLSGNAPIRSFRMATAIGELRQV